MLWIVLASAFRQSGRLALLKPTAVNATAYGQGGEDTLSVSFTGGALLSESRRLRDRPPAPGAVR